MPRIDLVVSSPIPRSSRARQLEGMFDVPRSETTVREWHGNVDLSAKSWNVGLIVGTSGAGKSLCAKALFGEFESKLSWSKKSVIDDFPSDMPIGDIIEACQSVGFNTIPAWMRPYHVLSNGEKFRVELARRLLSQSDPVVVDEFTSVVDRQVAKIVSHAVQKMVRKNNRRFVAVSCHYDIVDWLQPDWILEPSIMALRWRSLQQRPQLQGCIRRVSWDTWRLFSPYHYMTSNMHRSARCYGLFVDDRIAAFAGLLFRPISNVRNNPSIVYGVSRLVTLPDFQGLGLSFRLVEHLGAAHRALGHRLHTYPAHPVFIRQFAKARGWVMINKPGRLTARTKISNVGRPELQFGGKRNAIFEYVGPSMDKSMAQKLLDRIE